MNYKITHKFGIFVYDEKTKVNNIKWFKVGQVITKVTFEKLSKGTQRYCEKIVKPRTRKKTTNK